MTTRKLASVLGLGAALLWPSPIALSAEDDAQPVAISEDEATEAEAIRYRQTFGLQG